jgi:hypothetical protein
LLLLVVPPATFAACSGPTDEEAACVVTTDRAEISVMVDGFDEMSCGRFDSFTPGVEDFPFPK